MNWMPQQYVTETYTLLAVISVVGLVLLLWHMNGRWSHMASRGQKMRYYALMLFTMSGAYTAIELIQLNVSWSLRHWFDLGTALFLIGAIVVSIRDDRRNGPERQIP